MLKYFEAQELLENQANNIIRYGKNTIIEA